jgi:transcriptional regulator with XRE-family HTH domain
MQEATVNQSTSDQEKTTIRKARYALHWRQSELAAAAGVSVPVISRMENGHPIQSTSFKLVCLALGVRPENIEGVTIYDALEASVQRFQ